MKKTLSLLFAVIFAASLHAQTAKSRSDLYTEIDTQLASNQQMSAATLRATIKNLTASSYNALTDGQVLTASAANSLYQPLSSQLSNLAALSGSNVIYYRNSSGSWVAVTIGSGLTFSGGTLSSTAGGGNMSTSVYDTDGNGVVDTAAAAPWSGITSKPTTISGYGITDAQPLASALTSYANAADAAARRALIGAGTSSFDGAFASLSSKPTTLSGYGITDGITAASVASTYAPINNPIFTGTASIPALTVTGTLTLPAASIPDAAIVSTIARTSQLPTASSLGLVIGTNVVGYGGALGTPTSGNLANCTFPTLNQNTTGSAATLTNARTINGVSFNGSANITISTVSTSSVSYAATVTPAVSADRNELRIGSLTGNITIANPTGTPFDGQVLTIEFRQDSTGGRTYTFGTAYVFGTSVTLASIPTTASKAVEVGFKYNATDSKWRCVAVVGGF